MLVAMYCVAVLAAPHFLKKQSCGNFIVDHSTNMATVDVVAIPLLSCETIELTSFVDLASALTLAFGAIATCAFVVGYSFLAAAWSSTAGACIFHTVHCTRIPHAG